MVPDVFYRAYTIHGVIEKSLRPLVNVTVSGNINDFEVVRNAKRRAQPDTETQFSFYLGKAV